MIDVHVDIVSNPDTVTHTSNGIIDQKLLIFRKIIEVFVFPPPTNPRIDVIELAPQTLMTPLVQEIFADAAFGNAWTNRTPREISRTAVGRSTQISTQIHSGFSKTSNPNSNESTRTSISVGTSGTSTASPAEDLKSPGIENKQQSASPIYQNL